MYKSEKKMIKVTDDWYGCYNGDEIELKIFMYYNELDGCDEYGEQYSNYNGMVKVIASGNDDFAMELEFVLPSSFHTSLYNVYDTWKEHIYDKAQDGVNKKWFYEHGFLEA